MRKAALEHASAVLVALCFALASLPGTLRAQNYDSPGLGAMPVAAHPQDYKPLGIRAGAFMLHPGVTLAAQWTDNALYATDGLQSDTIYHVRPYLTAQSTWSRHSFNVRLAADIARYADLKERDYEDYFFGVGGRIDVKNRSAFNYSLDYMNLHEGLNNRSSEQGVQPTRYDVYGARIGYDHGFNRVSLGGNISWGRFDYDDVIGFDGAIIDNEDRDRDTQSFTVRAGYQFVVDKQLFISYTGSTTSYDQQFDRNGFDRSGSGYTVTGGIHFSMTDYLNGSIGVSYHSRDFDDPRLPSTSRWTLGGSGSLGLRWTPTGLTTVYLSMSSGVQDTTDANSTSYINTTLALRVDHELTRSVQLSGFVAYGISDYQPIDSSVEDTRGRDNTLRAGLGLNWFINRHMFLNASYSWHQLQSSVDNDDYSVNTIWLSLGLEY